MPNNATSHALSEPLASEIGPDYTTLRAMRETRGYSVEELSLTCGLSVGEIEDIENGRAADPVEAAPYRVRASDAPGRSDRFRRTDAGRARSTAGIDQYQSCKRTRQGPLGGFLVDVTVFSGRPGLPICRSHVFIRAASKSLPIGCPRHRV